jgi:pyruvate, water dikinase
VGGKTASLGELYSALARQGVRVPNGFALTASAYRDALKEAGAWDELGGLLAGLDKRNIADLAKRARAARAMVYAATDQEYLRREVADACRQLEQEYGANIAVAVRSSATAEDLLTASFAGQQRAFSTFVVRMTSCAHAGDTLPRCLLIEQSPIASTIVSIISRSRYPLRS